VQEGTMCPLDAGSSLVINAGGLWAFSQNRYCCSPTCCSCILTMERRVSESALSSFVTITVHPKFTR